MVVMRSFLIGSPKSMSARGFASGRAPGVTKSAALMLCLLNISLLLLPVCLVHSAVADGAADGGDGDAEASSASSNTPELMPDQDSFEEAMPTLLKEMLTNISKQLGGQSTSTEVVTSHVISSVDALVLANGDGDIDLTDGKCSSEVELFCPGVIPGFNRLAMCLWDEYQIRGYSDRNRVTAQRGRFSHECIDYVVDLQKKLNKNINGDVQIAWACKGDVESLCSDEHSDVLSCLEDEYSSLQSDQCKVLVREKIKMSNKDWRLDPGLNEDCAEDMQTLCKHTDEDEHGAKYKCLLQYLNHASGKCQKQVFRHKVMTLGPGDYRLAQQVTRDMKQNPLPHWSIPNLRQTSAVAIECLNPSTKRNLNSIYKHDCKVLSAALRSTLPRTKTERTRTIDEINNFFLSFLFLNNR